MKLKLAELELWKRKAVACDAALAYLEGREHSEDGFAVLQILSEASRSEAGNTPEGGAR